MEDPSHGGLKSSWCIGQPKWHDHKLKVPTMTSEGILLNIFLSNSDLMVVGSQINCHKVTCTVKLINQLINLWDGVPVLDCPFVQYPIINAHP